MKRPTQAVILAGGRGTRLGTLTDTRPKPMLEVHGRPFLEYLVEMLREQGFSDVLLLLGYLAPVIQNHFGNGSRFGVRISYSITAPEDLTTHRMLVARDQLDDLFLLMYCDNYWPMQFDRLWDQYVKSGALALTTVYSNKDRYTKDSVKVGADGFMEIFDRSRTTPGLQGVEISYAILRLDLLDRLPNPNLLIEEALYPQLTRERQLAAHVTDHRYYSVGSPQRLPLTEEFLARKPAVILDRDGVLNRRPPRGEYVRHAGEFEWLPGSLEALRLFHEAGYRIIVASNQAGVARGQLTTDSLETIHDRARTEAQRAGGAIDAIYYCPHDWDDGCECRKPKPGLLFQAQRDFSLDLTRTHFLGDDERDLQAAEAAGAPGLLVTDEQSLLVRARQLVSSNVIVNS
jgi:D-glycero-D-manno-heptose 1,7-bisphosphate phosphatase